MKDVRTNADLLDKRLEELKRFLDEPIPPKPEEIGPKIREFLPLFVGVCYENASDETKDRLIEIYDLCVIAFPGDSPKSYRLQLTARIPIEFEGVVESPASLQIVLASSRGGLRG